MNSESSPIAVPNYAETISNYTPAPFVFRAAALLIDSLVVAILQQLFSILIVRFFDSFTVQIIAALAGLVIQFFVIIRPLAETGQSPGKKIMRLRLESEEHPGPPTLGTVVLREVPGKLLSSILLGFGYLMALGPAKKTLHDRMCKTRVVKL